LKVSVFYLPTAVFCKTTQERIVGGTVTDTNFLGQLRHAGKGRAVGAFVFGVPSIVAVVINYLNLGENRGAFPSHTLLADSTFWFSLLWCIIAAVLFITIWAALLR
jgi:hypothetical protein